MTIPQRSIRRTSRWTAVAAVILACWLAAPTDAHASDGSAQVWAAALAANANDAADGGQWGPGTQLGLRVGISDFWSLVAGADASYHFSRTVDDEELPSSEVLGLFGGVRYNLDVFQYIPYLGVSLVNFVAAPPDENGNDPARVGAKLSVGVDWRYSREWSVGAAAELHAPLTDPGTFPNYSTVGLNLAYHFRI